MTRLYIAPKEMCYQAHFQNLFHPISGWHFLALDDGMVIVAAQFPSEDKENEFLAMEGVAALPDPILEGNVKLSAHRDSDRTAYVAKHHEALKTHPAGISDGDTVLDVSRKLNHPLVKIRHTT